MNTMTTTAPSIPQLHRDQKKEKRGGALLLGWGVSSGRLLLLARLAAPSVAAVALGTAAGIGLVRHDGDRQASGAAGSSWVGSILDSSGLQKALPVPDAARRDTLRFVNAGGLGASVSGPEALAAGQGAAGAAAVAEAGAANGAQDPAALGADKAEAAAEDAGTGQTGAADAARRAAGVLAGREGRSFQGIGRSSSFGGGMGGASFSNAAGRDSNGSLIAAGNVLGRTGKFRGDHRVLMPARARGLSSLNLDQTRGKLSQLHNAMTASRSDDAGAVADQHAQLWSSGSPSTGGTGTSLSGLGTTSGSGGVVGSGSNSEGGPVFGGISHRIPPTKPEGPSAPPIGPIEDKTPNQDLMELAQRLMMLASVALGLAQMFHMLANSFKMNPLLFTLCKGACMVFAAAAAVMGAALLVIGIAIAAKGDGLQGTIFTIMGLLITVFAVKTLIDGYGLNQKDIDAKLDAEKAKADAAEKAEADAAADKGSSSGGDGEGSAEPKKTGGIAGPGGDGQPAAPPEPAPADAPPAPESTPAEPSAPVEPKPEIKPVETQSEPPARDPMELSEKEGKARLMRMLDTNHHSVEVRSQSQVGR